MAEPSTRCTCPHINQSLAVLKCNWRATLLPLLQTTKHRLVFKFVFTENVLRETTNSFWDWPIDQLCYWQQRNQHKNHPCAPDRCSLPDSEVTPQHLLCWVKTDFQGVKGCWRFSKQSDLYETERWNIIKWTALMLLFWWVFYIFWFVFVCFLHTQKKPDIVA